MVFCGACGSDPCEWEEFGEQLRSHGNELIEIQHDMEHSKIRKAMYQLYIRLKHGYMGKGNRTCTPLCIRNNIRNIWPEEDPEDYMGHRDA